MHPSRPELDPSVEAAPAAHNPPHVAILASEAFRRFQNAVRILLNFEGADLLNNGVINDVVEWRRFADNPILWFNRADERRAAALWTLIESRQPSALRAPPLAPLSIAAE